VQQNKNVWRSIKIFPVIGGVVTIAPRDHPNCAVAMRVVGFCEANVDALRPRKNSVAPEGQGVGIFWILLWTGAADDVNVGLSVGRNLSKVRHLVFLVKRFADNGDRLCHDYFCGSVAAQRFLRMTKFSASQTIMLSQQEMRVLQG
jgi:hypothetical protein